MSKILVQVVDGKEGEELLIHECDYWWMVGLVEHLGGKIDTIDLPGTGYGVQKLRPEHVARFVEIMACAADHHRVPETTRGVCRVLADWTPSGGWEVVV